MSNNSVTLHCMNEQLRYKWNAPFGYVQTAGIETCIGGLPYAAIRGRRAATSLPQASPNSRSRPGCVCSHNTYDTPTMAPLPASDGKGEKTLSAPISHDHDKLVALTAACLINKGYTRVRACHVARFTACDQIGDYIPDVTAFNGNILVIVEAESRDGLAQAHTAAQWKTFHSHASRVGGYFIVVVNKSDEITARALLTQVRGSATNAQVWTF